MEIIKKTEKYVEKTLKNDGTGHDWWHVHRVRKTSLELGQKENADLFVVELAALLHDIADWKFHGGDDTKGPETARKWLQKFDLEENIIDQVCKIIEEISFKGAGVKTKMTTIEGKVVQDADRLDALGAIGIARTFAYGGNKNREIYNPEIKPQFHQSFEEYKKNQGTSLNHFYEKLLLLKDLMNTKTGKEIAEKKHQFMKQFLDNFLCEWEGQDYL